MLNILILDDVTTPTLSPTSPMYHTYVDTAEAQLFLITSEGAVPKHDQGKYRGFVELKSVCTDGVVELIAKAWHDKFTIHEIYCKHEDLLIRAAYLRKLFKIQHSGLQADSVFAFRDKLEMKEIASKSGIPVPKFTLLNSPCCLLSFVEEHGLPVVVKPNYGSASAGVQVLHTHQHVVDFLSNEYFKVLDNQGRRLEACGQWVAEKYMEGTMYHVNGFIEQGRITHLWPFQNIQTNFLFTQGEPYGNISMVSSDPDFRPLCKATQSVLSCFSLPQRMVFHIEFFKIHPSQTQSLLLPSNSSFQKRLPKFALCEIAARKPGGSIPSLINSLLLPHREKQGSFDALEFRFQCGLSLPSLPRPTKRVADLLVPHRSHSILLSVPPKSAFPLQSYVQYQPYAEAGVVYDHFRVDTLNTLAKFTTTMEGNGSMHSVWYALGDAYAWLMQHCSWMDTPAPTSTGLMKKSVYFSHLQRRFEQRRAQGMQVTCRGRSPAFTLLRHLHTQPWQTKTLVVHKQVPWQRVFQRPTLGLVRRTAWMALHRRVWYATRAPPTMGSTASSSLSRIHMMGATASSALVRIKDLPSSPVLANVHAKFGSPEWKDGKNYILVSEKTPSRSSGIRIFKSHQQPQNESKKVSKIIVSL